MCRITNLGVNVLARYVHFGDRMEGRPVYPLKIKLGGRGVEQVSRAREIQMGTSMRVVITSQEKSSNIFAVAKDRSMAVAVPVRSSHESHYHRSKDRGLFVTKG